MTGLARLAAGKPVAVHHKERRRRVKEKQTVGLIRSHPGWNFDAQQVQPLADLRGRLDHRRAREGLPSCASPISDRFLDPAGLGAMMRQKFGLLIDHFGKAIFENCRDTSVQLLPPRAEQGSVGGVLH